MAPTLTLPQGDQTGRYEKGSVAIARFMEETAWMRETMKAKLVMCLVEEVGDRDARAHGCPDDDRHAASVLAMASAVSEITSWPDDDHRLWQLGTLQATSAIDVFSPCEESRRLISRYGLASGSWSSAEGLVTLVLDAEIRATTENLDDEMRWHTMAGDEDA
jgi:hypothetical protein